ncbi:unnamed protein product [Pleuronectes platessa]|uniref:Uncharacterized protein n=1 Tax=Pleuronectes platessa TaxID=8262 RepID=A0A9N7YQZ0_PLEPL|nr:unnamed protein product [Pleuronectes platessa]
MRRNNSGVTLNETGVFKRKSGDESSMGPSRGFFALQPSEDSRRYRGGGVSGRDWKGQQKGPVLTASVWRCPARVLHIPLPAPQVWLRSGQSPTDVPDNPSICDGEGASSPAYGRADSYCRDKEVCV